MLFMFCAVLSSFRTENAKYFMYTTFTRYTSPHKCMSLKLSSGNLQSDLYHLNRYRSE